MGINQRHAEIEWKRGGDRKRRGSSEQRDFYSWVFKEESEMTGGKKIPLGGLQPQREDLGREGEQILGIDEKKRKHLYLNGRLRSNQGKKQAQEQRAGRINRGLGLVAFGCEPFETCV